MQSALVRLLTARRFAPENFCFTNTLEGLLAPNAPCRNDYECPSNAGCWAPTEFGFNADPFGVGARQA